MYHNALIHPSVDWIGPFSPFGFGKSVAMNTHVHAFEYLFSILWGIYKEWNWWVI